MNKKAILGSIFLMTSLIQPVLAQEINSKEDFEIWCSPQAYYYNAQHPDCEELRKIWVPETRENPVVRPREEPQTRENQRPREEHRFVEGTPTRRNYGTVTGGAFFQSANDDDRFEPETGAGFPLSYGHLYGPNFALETELVSITGNARVGIFEGPYIFLGLVVAPMFRLPFSQSSRSAFFVSPGIGFGFTTFNTSNSIVPLEGDDSGFVFQIKTGVEFEISNKLSLLFQGRYVNTSAGLTSVAPNLGTWSPEIGIRFWF